MHIVHMAEGSINSHIYSLCVGVSRLVRVFRVMNINALKASLVGVTLNEDPTSQGTLDGGRSSPFHDDLCTVERQREVRIIGLKAVALPDPVHPGCSSQRGKGRPPLQACACRLSPSSGR